MERFPTDFSAISASQTPALVSRLVSLVVISFVLIPVLMLFLPWQQNVQGTGFVSALTPLERQQSIDAPVSGRIVNWLIQEGSTVKQGDLLLEMADLDPLLAERLNGKQAATQSKLEARQQQIEAQQTQIEQLQTVRDMKVMAAQYKLDMARQKTRSARESLAAAQARLDTAVIQQSRLANLLTDGLVSQRDVDLIERDVIVARRSVNSATASLNAAQAEQQSTNADVEQVRADTQAKINKANASISKIRSEIEDVRKQLLDNQVSIARLSQRRVYAARDGRILRLFNNPQGTVVKQGEKLAVLVPDIQQRAVEVWVSGNDAPLIQPGHHARLMFEGWPAVQFVGWPEVAVGTFGGTVSFVDASSSNKGKFRVLIIPDERDHPWPSARYLRQGGAVKSWILLQQVSLGYEIWRQLNGFPPMLTPEHPYKDLERKGSAFKPR
ncbi:MAG: HlyD family secretion protein [Gammaproteobacteria bacterium]|nr:HlyD family secretion protein [Gammaproteobacteria bacterium]